MIQGIEKQDLYCGLGEEAFELASAACKFIRVREGRNITNVTYADAEKNLKIELADVMNYMDEIIDCLKIHSGCVYTYNGNSHLGENEVLEYLARSAAIFGDCTLRLLQSDESLVEWIACANIWYSYMMQACSKFGWDLAQINTYKKMKMSRWRARQMNPEIYGGSNG